METDLAVAKAHDELGLTLESTYTGKAMAALIRDHEQGLTRSASVMFWNTYNSRPLEIDNTVAPDFSVIPREFARYFDW